MKGVDLSHWNSVASFWELKNAGYDFAILKATQGSSETDPKFEDYYARATEVGLPVGCYHFAMPDTGAIAQAEHFAEYTIGKTFAMGHWVDVEMPGISQLTNHDRSLWLRMMLERCRMLNLDVGIYCAPMWFRHYFNVQDFKATKFWLATLGRPYDKALFPNVTIEQLSWGLNAPGIGPGTDEDVVSAPTS